ncbi:hypothetical protein FGRMN_7045 [Fusarium graminum]|nr:hypothetical protein FGRMN_7045 [Fusarium graminum]
MSHADTHRAKKWAILVGIEYYDNSERPASLFTARYTTRGNRIQYKSLDGCVNDVLAVQQYLVDKIKVDPDNIVTLLAPHSDRNYICPLPVKYQEPTYENLVNAFKVPKGAKKGDFVYIHFSGHGARATTIFNKNETERAEILDEALVPSDINHGGRYLRDLELGFLLKQMADACLVVTAVLDCCHSGGAVRGDEEPYLGQARGISEVYKSNPDLDCPITSTDSVEWRDWLNCRSQRQHGFFTLTACQESETARERPGEGGTHGLLTYWLLKILGSSSANISSQSLYSRVISNVRDANRYQTPHYVGDSNRSFFSNELQSRIYSLTVKSESVGMHKEVVDREIWLDGGSIHGVKKGSEYIILPSSHDSSKELDQSKALARVRVIRVETGESLARFLQTNSVRWEDIRGGCLAVLASLPLEKRSTVRFDVSQQSIRDVIKNEWIKKGGDRTWLFLGDGDGDADFAITINKDGNFDISDENGDFEDVIKAALNPISSSDISALIYRLEYLARLRMTKSLSNPSVYPQRSRLMEVSLEPYIGPAIETNQFTWLPAKLKDHAEGLFEVPEQRLFNIRIKNRSRRRIGCVVMNCASELGVQKLFPSHEPFHALGVDEDVNACIGFSIEPEFRQKLDKANVRIVDLVKVFACTPERDLDSLQLQPLIFSERGGQDLSSGSLDGLLAELNTQRLGFYIPLSTPKEPEWDNEDIRFWITPAEAS